MTAKWLERFRNCINCGRKADGVLRDERNGDLGYYCAKCADLKIAFDKERADEFRRLA